ncbi:MAG: 4'-phosphopantetheinyl transferase superfamily protein [Myxococcota bacterium]|nr:4'-phosphopantetheinyl transferase superfamily protein [Myxococcota bacterium]
MWYQRVADADAEATGNDLELLSPHECEVHAALRAEAQPEYRAAHALLRRVLSRYLPLSPGAWIFESDDEGRPRVANAPGDSGLDFNLSHTQGLVACAVTRSGRVGIDVEVLGPERKLDRVAARILGDRERSWWQGLPSEDQALALLDLWTLKEAHFKASSKGVRWPFSSLEFVLGSEEEVSRLDATRASSEGEAWHYARRALSSRHRMAVAFLGNEKPLWQIAAFPG